MNFLICLFPTLVSVSVLAISSRQVTTSILQPDWYFPSRQIKKKLELNPGNWNPALLEVPWNYLHFSIALLYAFYCFVSGP